MDIRCIRLQFWVRRHRERATIVAIFFSLHRRRRRFWNERGYIWIRSRRDNSHAMPASAALYQSPNRAAQFATLKIHFKYFQLRLQEFLNYICQLSLRGIRTQDPDLTVYTYLPLDYSCWCRILFSNQYIWQMSYLVTYLLLLTYLLTYIQTFVYLLGPDFLWL